MTGNIWMFSHLIDEEDLLFAQHADWTFGRSEAEVMLKITEK